MIRNLVISLALAMSATCMAQSDYQYRMEIGAGVGAVAYQGDFGGSLTKNMQSMASAVLRRVFNPYMALKFSAAYGKLKGSSDNAKTYYPDYASEHIVLISFSACHGDARNLYGARCSGIGYVRVYDFVLRLCDDAACNDAECGQHLSYIHCLLIVFILLILDVYSLLAFFCFHLFAGLSESALALLVVGNGFVQVGFVEVGPESIAEIQFRVGYLPQQIVADSQLASGAY